MKVLVAHNRYRSDAPSGENDLVEAEISLLQQNEVAVVPLIRSSDELAGKPLGALHGAPGPIYARSGVREFRTLLQTERPDVVHLHNVFPLISPWVIREANDQGIPVVQTVHNYRHTCVNGLHFRDGAPCLDCVGTSMQLPGLLHGCYRGSRLQTLPMTLGQNVHAQTWRGGIARFLALTPFMRSHLEASGIPSQRIGLRPTWVSDPGFSEVNSEDILYVGRLDESKGIELLLEAWKRRHLENGRRLVIVGDGPLFPQVQAAAAGDPTIVVLGRLPKPTVLDHMRSSGAIAVPSLCLEGYPLVVAESFGVGRGVLTVRGGAVESILGTDCGWVASADADSLAAAIDAVTLESARSVGESARRRFARDNSPDAALRSLLETYATLRETS
jgi:glycosyltransferase involved in cell wall biosynthesis